MQRTLSVLAIAAIALTLPFLSFAQIQKGKVLLGGAFNVNSNKADNAFDTLTNHSSDQSFSTSTKLEVGYFIKNNVAVGLRLGNSQSVSSNTLNHTNANQYKGNSNSLSWSVGPMVRLYKPITEKFYFFLNAEGYYSMGNYENSRTQQSNDPFKTKYESNSQSVNLSLTPGITYFLSKKFAFELTGPGIGVYNSTVKDKNYANDIEISSSKRNYTSFDLNPFRFTLDNFFSNIYIGGKFYF